MHAVIAPSFAELLDSSEPVEQLATGFDFTEGPIWHPIEQHLLFSDMPGDVRRRWSKANGVEEVTRPANKCNGQSYDQQHNLLVCEHSTSCVVKIDSNGFRTVLASHFDGKELNSPNDLCVRSDGSIYFTDPWYGRMPGVGVERPRELGWQGVFRIQPNQIGAEPQLLVDRYLFSMPNGLCLSPDERFLYVNDTEQANIRVFDVAQDGSLSNARIFATGITSSLEQGVPDGMRCDERGNIWVTAPGGVWVYDPSGQHIGKVRVPELVANMHWGGADMHTLFLCASTSLYSLKTKVAPNTEPFMKGGAGRESTLIENTIEMSDLQDLDPSRSALIVQEFQNDVATVGGAFESSGSPAHCKAQNAISNIVDLANACRAKNIPVIHVWFTVQAGAPEMTMNTPLFRSLRESGGLINASWGAAPVSEVEPHENDFIVYKSRMSPWEGTNLETILRASGRDVIINTGGWTNLSVEHTARTAADKGYRVIQPHDACFSMSEDWHRASINYSIQLIATVTDTQTLINCLR